MTHFGAEEHRVHDLTFGLLVSAALAGVAAQLWRPQQQVASMQMALVPWLALLLAGALSSDLGRVVLRNPSVLLMPLTVIAAMLHPAGRRVLTSLRPSRARPGMIALVLVAAVPLLRWAVTNLDLQRRIPDEHAEMGHYGFMAALAFTILGIGMVASFRPVGWRLAAWVAGALAASLGIVSLLYPVSSSLAPLPAAASILWGGSFVTVAELLHRSSGAPSGRGAD